MQAIRTHVAGVDVHKDVLAITVLIGGEGEEVIVKQFECGTFTEDLIAMGTILLDLQVCEIALESTGVYWKPVYNVWAPLGIAVTVGNAAHIKNVPGRKTDLNDSHWIAKLHRFGLINPSFIPGPIFQQMRLLSRHRTNLQQDLSRIKNRVQKVLEDANIKYSSIASDVFGSAGMKILRLITDGVKDPKKLAVAITTRIKRRSEAEKALTNCLADEHCFIISELMEQYDSLVERIKKVEGELHQKVLPYSNLIEKLKEIPGISDILAMGILAEATDDMSNFKDERSFAAWSGVAAGNNESAGKKKDLNAGKVIHI